MFCSFFPVRYSVGGGQQCRNLATFRTGEELPYRGYRDTACRNNGLLIEITSRGKGLPVLSFYVGGGFGTEGVFIQHDDTVKYDYTCRFGSDTRQKSEFSCVAYYHFRVCINIF